MNNITEKEYELACLLHHLQDAPSSCELCIEEIGTMIAHSIKWRFDLLIRASDTCSLLRVHKPKTIEDCIKVTIKILKYAKEIRN